MSDDAYSLTERSIRELRRLLQTQQSEMMSLRRKVARLDGPRQVYKPSSPIQWFLLKEPLYPQSDLSPYNGSVWSAQACETTWNAETKQWDSVYPERLVTIYSTGNMYGMTDMVIPCQKRDDGWEPVASAPPDACYFEALNMGSFSTSGDLMGLSPSGYGFQEAAGTVSDKSGFLYYTDSPTRFAYPGSYFQKAIEYEDDSAPSTNGTFGVYFSGMYEVDLHVWGEIRSYYTGSGSNPRALEVSRTTGAASAGTAHTHSYNEWNYLGGSDPAPAFQAKIWTKPTGGSYAELEAMNVEHFPFASTSGVLRRNWSYRTRAACKLEEGDRVGVQVLSADLIACQMRLEGATLSFRLIIPGHTLMSGA